MSEAETMDPRAVVERLAASLRPLLLPVRHHSPACTLMVRSLLEEHRPAAIFVELPPEFMPWIEWLGHDDLVAPVALSARDEQGLISFLPLADFSPELEAIRYAKRHGVPVFACDGALERRSVEANDESAESDDGDAHERRRIAADLSWERLVEAPADGATPEEVRRAALLVGWARRLDEARDRGIDERDRRRETAMRDIIARNTPDDALVAAVVGAFHASALADPPLLYEALEPSPPLPGLETTLVPYDFELLDDRSGYPAGIRDPAWRQRVIEHRLRGESGAELASRFLVDVARALRSEGHDVSTADAIEALRLSIDLATLRGLMAPGRAETIEVVQTCFARGEVAGRGRAVAAALEALGVGRRRGRLPQAAPRAALVAGVIAHLEELGLPLPDDRTTRPVEMRLDPLRSRIDRRRHATLRRFEILGADYGSPRPSTAVTGEALTQVWRCRWTPATSAALEFAAGFGATLEAAAAGRWSQHRRALELRGDLTPGLEISFLESAAEAGLTGELEAHAASSLTRLVGTAKLEELVAAAAWLDRLGAGHFAASPNEPDDAVAGEIGTAPRLDPDLRAAIVHAAVASAEGMIGSESRSDVRALVSLSGLLERSDEITGASRLDRLLETMRDRGSPAMHAAATVLLARRARITPSNAAAAVESWLLDACDADGRRRLAGRIGGMLAAIERPAMHESLVAALAEAIERLDEREFLARLPALRGSFSKLDTFVRDEWIAWIAERYASDDARSARALLDESPVAADVFARADLAGEDAARSLLPEVALPTSAGSQSREPLPVSLDRWRLILGKERGLLAPRHASAARVLDDLYGGEMTETLPGDLSARDFAGEITANFAGIAPEEVLAGAAAAGRIDALLGLDPESVRPDVSLLRAMLDMRGGLPEAKLSGLRRLARRIVEALVDALAVRVRPSLAGVDSRRPTRRPTRRLHAAATVRANLRHARRDNEGVMRIVAEQPIFRSRQARVFDWRVILLVDVSGSMEPSTVWAALTASILARAPWLELEFLAFSDRIVDLSQHVGDPLDLLLEVRVGGGTRIAEALRAARRRLVVPTRTIIALVTDFDENGPIGAMLGEIRALRESGAVMIGVAALDDGGKGRFDRACAAAAVGAGMPVAAMSPEDLVRFIAEKIRG